MKTNILGILRLIAMASRRRPRRYVHDQKQYPSSVGEFMEAKEAAERCKVAQLECEPRRVRAGA